MIGSMVMPQCLPRVRCPDIVVIGTYLLVMVVVAIEGCLVAGLDMEANVPELIVPAAADELTMADFRF